jgi:hypothetical protein
MTFVNSYNILLSTTFFKKLTLTNVGYLMAFKELQMNLTRKLKVIDYIKKDPKILDIPVKSPIIVFGLGRSGTTLVHRLISLDPKNRAPRLWELLLPCPNIAPTSTLKQFDDDRKQRAQFVRDKIKERNRMGMNAMEEFHEIGADLPEEDMIGLSANLPTGFQYLYTFLCHPGHVLQEALRGKRVEDAYAQYRQFLQLLSFQTDTLNCERRWVLKFPVHILFIPELAKIFPDAKLVWYVSTFVFIC